MSVILASWVPMRPARWLASACYGAVIEPNVARHSGRLFKIMGDGFLAEFASAVQAAVCAVAIQKETEASAFGLDAARKMRLRIGVHVGDVMVDGDDLLGDGEIGRAHV